MPLPKKQISFDVFVAFRIFPVSYESKISQETTKTRKSEGGEEVNNKLKFKNSNPTEECKSFASFLSSRDKSGKKRNKNDFNAEQS